MPFLITQTQKAHLGKADEGGERHGQCVSSRELPAEQGKLLGRCSREKDAHLERRIQYSPRTALCPAPSRLITPCTALGEPNEWLQGNTGAWGWPRSSKNQIKNERRNACCQRRVAASQHPALNGSTSTLRCAVQSLPLGLLQLYLCRATAVMLFQSYKKEV